MYKLQSALHFVVHRTWKEVIGSLSTLYCWASLALGCGLGHLWNAGGSYGLNMMSW